MSAETDAFRPMSEREVDRIADAIARKRGAGPLHLMPESSAGQYRAMARAAVAATTECLVDRMESFPQGGRHTRASWAVAVMRDWSEKISA